MLGMFEKVSECLVILRWKFQSLEFKRCFFVTQSKLYNILQVTFNDFSTEKD
jgi:hypothetical protein